MDYYADFLAELNLLHLRRVLQQSAPAEAAMLEQALGRTGERAAQDLQGRDAVIQGLRAKVRKQQQRIDQLQGRATEVVGRKVMGYLRRR